MAEFKKAFVLGHPVKQSRSPLIHNHWIQRHGLTGSYEAIDVASGTLPLFLENVRSGQYVGGNITVPLKEEAFEAVDCLTGSAKSIGAVNTVYMENDKIWGDNTDAYGFSANLDNEAQGWRNCGNAVVVGAGGAARAIVKSLIDANIPSILVLNRTFERAEKLAKDFGQAVTAAPLDEFQSLIANAGLVINTSSIGMAGKGEWPFDFTAAGPSTLVTDIVYVPLETGFLKSAHGAGLKTIDGLGMLLHQAVPGFERWFGVRPTVNTQLRALIEADVLRAKP
jgi:shikimate dehydrogenase